MSWFDNALGGDFAKLFHIKMEIDGSTYERDIRPDVAIDYDVLETQLQETPSIFCTWAMFLAEARKAVSVIERAIKNRRGQLTRELLDAAKKEGTKLRASDVEFLLEDDEEVQRLEAKLIGANKNLSKLFAIVDALRMKSENLRSLAGFKRQEYRDSGS